MTQVVEQLAELTNYKDRDVMDVTMVVALRDMLLPLSVSIYRAVGAQEGLRWMTRARLSAGEAVASADALSTPLDQLPALDDYPARAACLRLGELRESASRSEFTCHFPLLSEHEGHGELEVVTRTRLSPSEQRTVRAILRVYHNFQGLLDDAERDGLTGLLNRKTFDTSFLKLLGGVNAGLPNPVMPGDRRHESGQRHWLGVVDIDHFKRVNDGFGHLIGDEVLLLLARLMRASFRYHDRLYRFGGEEFVVLLRADGEADAVAGFERLRVQCRQFAFPQVGQVTLSIGFTALRAGDTPTVAFDRADKAVYWAKQHGRDQAHAYERLVSEGQLQEVTKDDSDVELF